MRRIAFGASVLFAASVAHADVVLNESVGGHAIRVERGSDGMLTLRVEGRDAQPFGRGTPHAQRVTVGPSSVLVVRVDGESPYGAVIGAAGELLFTGSLAWRGDDPGERARAEIVIRDLDGDGHDDVVIGDRREDVRLCGLGMPLVDAQAIDPRTMRLAHVALNPLRVDLLPPGATMPRTIAINAVPVEADAASLTMRSLNVTTRVARGGTQAGGAVLTDHSEATTWTVARHDFATANATTAGYPIERVVITAPAPPAGVPRRFTLLFDGDGPALDVTVPPAVGAAAGARIAVPIVPPRDVSCVSLVVTESTSAPMALAELDVVTALARESNPVSALVDRLAGPHGDQAALLLASMGDVGIDAVSSAIGTMPLASARVAVRLLANTRTAHAAAGLVNALARRELEADARSALVHMGPAALDALSAAAATMPRAADVIAAIHAPVADRLHAVLPVLGAAREVFHVARGAVRAIVDEAAHANQLGVWIAMLPADPGAAARGLTLAAEVATDDAQRAAVAQRARTVDGARFEDRYRLLVPLAGDADGRAAVIAVAQSDPNADLRAEAVRALAGRDADETIVHALADRVPRVRAAAARALAGSAIGRAVLARTSHDDTWPSVRARAVEALAGDAANAQTLMSALDDPSVVVVRAAIAAIARTPGTSAERLMAFAEDDHRNPDLRADALHIIATHCVRSLAPRLEALARHHIDPILPPPEQAVGHEALAALAHLDPARARAFLRSMEANQMAVNAVERAARDACPVR
jgi:hypothetical protein